MEEVLPWLYLKGILTGDVCFFMICIVYIDLNMVWAGVVSHSSECRLRGVSEIPNPAKRYVVINRKALLDLFSIDNQERFRQERRYWVEAGSSIKTISSNYA